MINYGTLKITESTKILIENTETTTAQNSNNNKVFGMCRSSILFTLYLFIYILYLSCGAAIFSILECPEEQAVKTRVDLVIHKFLADHPSVTGQELDDLLSEVTSASSKGIAVARNISNEEPNWSFGQSLFFAGTVVTTIGYGHITPLTTNGKLFCIIYAIIGIPLTLVLISGLVQRLLTPTVLLLEWLNGRLGHLSRPFSIRLLHLIIMGLILIGFFLIIPASIFAYLEPDWGFLDSFYYSFISLTTIGLGDYIPGDSPGQRNRSVYKIAITGYLFLGLTFLMLTLAVFYEIPQLNLTLLFTNENDVSLKSNKIGNTSQRKRKGRKKENKKEPNNNLIVNVKAKRKEEYFGEIENTV